MKLRTYLLIANGASIGLILACLLFIYKFMLLSFEQVILLSSITFGAGLTSFALHYFMTRPVEKAIHLIAQESERIAEGRFHGGVPQIGPAEFQMLAVRFNEMSGKLDESFQSLRSSEASRRELVAGVSHDLRTPLASIQSFVEALQDDIIRDKETFNRYLTTIRLETRRLSGLIDDLFQLSQLEAGAHRFQPEPCNADDLILEALEINALTFEEKRLEVSVDIPNRLPPVSAMPEQINRVLTNLLSNAIRHSPEGASIRIDVSNPEPFVRVEIQDQGEGVPESEQKHIFDRFYRVDKSRNRWSGGAGLGLAIAKSIVELHGGSIGVTSNPSEGSKFWFTLPCYSDTIE